MQQWFNIRKPIHVIHHISSMNTHTHTEISLFMQKRHLMKSTCEKRTKHFSLIFSFNTAQNFSVTRCVLLFPHKLSSSPETLSGDSVQPHETGPQNCPSVEIVNYKSQVVTSAPDQQVINWDSHISSQDSRIFQDSSQNSRKHLCLSVYCKGY